MTSDSEYYFYQILCKNTNLRELNVYESARKGSIKQDFADRTFFKPFRQPSLKKLCLCWHIPNEW